MMKSIIAISGIAALTIALVGCGGGSKEETKESTSAETTTITENTTASSATESSEATTTAEGTEKAETTEAKTAPSGEVVEKATDASAFYDEYVSKLKDGFKESGTSLYYTADAGNYKYSVADNMTGHSVEATVESMASSLTDGDCGKTGDMLYATGKNSSGSFYTAVYSRIGEGDSTSCYGAVEYLSDKEVSPEDVGTLLSSDYVTFVKK